MECGGIWSEGVVLLSRERVEGYLLISLLRDK